MKNKDFCRGFCGVIAKRSKTSSFRLNLVNYATNVMLTGIFVETNMYLSKISNSNVFFRKNIELSYKIKIFMCSL